MISLAWRLPDRHDGDQAQLAYKEPNYGARLVANLSLASLLLLVSLVVHPILEQGTPLFVVLVLIFIAAC